jgi:hypothetical protein
LWLARYVKHPRPMPAGYSRFGISPRAGASGAKSGNDVRAEDHLKSAGDSKIGGSVSRASSVPSPLFGHLPTQHPPYQSRRRRQPRLHRSTPSPTEEGAAKVYSISGRGRRGGGLLHLWPREARRRSSLTPSLSSKSAVTVSNATGTYITMPSGSFCPCNC